MAIIETIRRSDGSRSAPAAGASPTGAGDDLPAAFATALAQIRGASIRSDVIIEEVPPPRRVAPFAVALDGQIDVEAVTNRLARPRAGALRPVSQHARHRPVDHDRDDSDDSDDGDGITADLADAGGRFVLLHDPARPVDWQGDQRVIALIKAVVEPELVTDPMLPDIAWAWLGEELRSAGAQWSELGGTVTQVSSRSFGALQSRRASVQVELRASWTPTGPMDAHVVAWGAALCRFAGVPPMSPDVISLDSRRGTGLNG